VGLSTRKLRVERGPSAEPSLAGYFIEQHAHNIAGTVAVGERMRHWIFFYILFSHYKTLPDVVLRGRRSEHTRTPVLIRHLML